MAMQDVCECLFENKYCFIFLHFASFERNYDGDGDGSGGDNGEEEKKMVI